MKLYNLLILTKNTLFFFVRPAGNGNLLLIKYKPIIMVGLMRYNQSGVTELLIMRDSHYGRMCFKSVKTLGALHS